MRFIVSLACLLFAFGPARGEKPNVVFVLADDLGYADLGCFGQTKIKTPVLDGLAKQGMRLTRHYSGNNVCAPSRCVLMTGFHPGHAEVRNNREAKPEGQFPLSKDAVTLAKLLKGHGYATGAFGKWGLGGPDTDGRPLKQGFDRFFGYNCQRVAHSFYPESLWDDEKVVKLNDPAIPGHGQLGKDDDPKDRDSYARFRGKVYAPDRITEAALEFVKANRDRPFFLYWPTTVPHLALQVPEEAVKEYSGKWDDPPYPGGKSYTPTFEPRATYAGMVTRMDRDIGRLMERIREYGLDRKTIFVFSSDNGPLFDKLGGTDCEFFNSHGGLRGRKGSMYEGGIRVPCIVCVPGVVKPGTESDRVTGFEDWMPTLLELCGAKAPSGIDGISFVPTLRGEKQPEREFLYRESPGYGGQQTVRVGRWKAVRQNLNGKKGTPKTELYDLDADPTESRDVSATQPEVLARLEKVMKEQHRRSEAFPIELLDRE
jgi:arylsulfatase A